jgi:hypothetical protein
VDPAEVADIGILFGTYDLNLELSEVVELIGCGHADLNAGAAYH